MGGNGDIVYPGVDNIPHVSKGPPLLYKDSDPDHKKPQKSGHIKCKIFDLGDQDQRAEYEKSMSRIYAMQTRGAANLVSVDRKYVEDRATWLVYVEWIEYYTYDPPGSCNNLNQVENKYLWRRN